MLCPRCHGTRFLEVPGGGRLPCPECGGGGLIHCCDGLTEQPDPACDPPRSDRKASDRPGERPA